MLGCLFFLLHHETGSVWSFLKFFFKAQIISHELIETKREDGNEKNTECSIPS